jgi:2-phosphosulfolactate phosphatase
MQPGSLDAGSRPLTLDVALLPSLVADAPQRRSQTRYIVVDVIRATTTLTLLFESGCTEVLIAPGIAQARAARDALGGDYLLAGEVGGARPPGFDLGNSPSEVASANLHGHAVIFATTNGTRALRACAGGRAVLAGSLRNAAAVCSAAIALTPDRLTPLTEPGLDSVVESGGASDVEEPQRQPEVVVVCSGRLGSPAYDDTLCAGYLIRELMRCTAACEQAAQLTESARIALAVLEAAEQRWSLLDALASSDAARAIARIGLARDLDWCAAPDTAQSVPALTDVAAASGLLTLRDLRHEPGNR